jgi:hypothetical protein
MVKAAPRRRTTKAGLVVAGIFCQDAAQIAAAQTAA